MTIRTTMSAVLAFARGLLHALAETGAPAHQELRPLLGPNGAQMWTSSLQVDRRQPSAGGAITTVEIPVEVTVRRRQRETRRRVRTLAA